MPNGFRSAPVGSAERLGEVALRLLLALGILRLGARRAEKKSE
jgi:hypothetical protein